MTVKQRTEHNLEFLSLKGSYTGLSESALVKMPHCWKSHVAAQIYVNMVEKNSDQHTHINSIFPMYDFGLIRDARKNGMDLK